MAQKVTVQFVDDLNGASSEDVSTIPFGLDGVSYEIDLSGANAERLRDSLREFVNSARRTGGRLKRDPTPRSGPAGNNGEASQVREWALNNGYELSGRGRIPNHVTEAYTEAQAEAQAPAKKKAVRSRARAKKS